MTYCQSGQQFTHRMLFRLLFLLTALETFLLSIYMAFIGSTSQASLLFNLSPARLALVAAFFLFGLALLILALRPVIKKGWRFSFEDKVLGSQKAVWLIFISGSLVAGLAIFLLTRQINAFGDYKLIYQRLEPALVWLAALGVQASFFAAIWYCARFLPKKIEKGNVELQSELLPLFALFAGFLVVKLLFVSSTAYGPLGRGDEMTYYDMADAFYRGFFSPKDTNHYPPLYPLSLVVTLVFKAWTFDGIKLLNAIFSSSLVFPVYFIARHHVDAKASLLTAFFSCLIPYHLVFPRRILSENLFFPLFLWTMLITYSQPSDEKYRLPWDALNGIMIAALYLTRYITLAIIPFLLLSWWAKPHPSEKSFFRPGFKKILHFLVVCLSFLMDFSPWLLSGISEGVPLRLLLGFGIAARTTQAQLTIPRLLGWALLYACYFVLVAAPVLNLMIISLWQIDVRKWRVTFGRWVFQTLALMGGFYLAVTRHSWRAFYNADMPAAIMGRYLIVFSVVYFIIAVTVITNFDRTRFKPGWGFALIAQALPFGLVIFAYMTLIKGAIIPTDGNLFKSLGSVDGFFTELLGPFFFLLIFLIYGVTNWLAYNGRRKTALGALAFGLLVYYSIGIPAYYRDLMAYQTYPYLARQISHLLPPPDPKSGATERVTVFLPKERTTKSGAEIYNGLRTYGYPCTIIEGYSAEGVDQMATDLGFIIVRLPDGLSQENLPILEINSMQFQIIPLSK